MTLAPESTITPKSGWHGSLSLGFEYRADRTILAHRKHYGPLLVQRPFYPEGEPCHIYLLHPPGGVVPGDELTVRVKVGDRAHALVTTPAAGKLYRSHGPRQVVSNVLRVEKRGYLEWLPQETIIFDGADGRLTTRVELDSEARFAGWELVCFGRPASKALFERGSCRQHFELWRDGLPVSLERSVFVGSEPIGQACWGLENHTVSGTFMVSGPEPLSDAVITAARELCEARPTLTMTQLEGVLVARYLGDSAEQGRHVFTEFWELVRPELCERNVCIPRIWNT